MTAGSWFRSGSNGFDAMANASSQSSHHHHHHHHHQYQQQHHHHQHSTFANRVPIKEAIRGIYPSAAGEQTEVDRNRFSQLLLEHGEQHLQDWAVVASSNEAASVPSGSNGRKGKSGIVMSSHGHGHGHGHGHSGGIHASSYAKGSPSGRSYATTKSTGNTTEWNKSGRTKSRRVVPDRTSGKAPKETSPTANMGRIEGRLHLCSRSIVFEPQDSTRGIIRCPFSRMDSPPRGSSGPGAVSLRGGGNDSSSSTPSLLGASYETIASPLTIDFQSTRYVVMKENNVIGPFETIETVVNFRFTFLHSSPERFVELCVELYRMVKSNKFSIEALEDIMKPMLNRPFDASNLVDFREKALTSNLRCTLVSPLQTRPGCAIVTSQRLYFQPSAGVLSPMETRATSWILGDIMAVARRYSGLKDCAIEVYWKTGSSVLLAFERQREREKVLRVLPNKHSIWAHTDPEFVAEASAEWLKGTLSNYEYLLALNSAAGRTFHDLSRYPVFPWVIADYTSEKLDLSKRETFRDLTKPMGALNEERLEYFRNRLHGMQDMEAFLYGTHYSAPGYILYYLVRSMPEHMLCLQNGKFDAPDRMFFSISNCFSCALTNHADVKELIPEFYNPSGGFDFLINARNLQLGATQHGERVNDVILPPWARSPRDYLKKNRKALEADLCTKMLPAWIDLIFGVKSRGEAAMEASNLFHPNAYFGPADLEAMATDIERSQAQLQAVEFGIIPDQLFVNAHPGKYDAVDGSDFISPTLGKVETVTESDGLTDADSSKQGEQTWELLEPPSNQIQEEAAPRAIERVESHESGNQRSISVSSSFSPSRSVGFGAAGMVSSATMKKFSNKVSPGLPPSDSESSHDLLTPGGKAKASWASTNAPPVPSADTFEEAERQRNGIGYRREDGGTEHMAGIHQPHLENGHPRSSRRTSESDRGPSRKIAFSGSGGLSKGVERTNASFGSAGHGPTTANTTSDRDSPKGPPPVEQSSQASDAEWELKPIEKKRPHTDAVTGCFVVPQQGPQDATLITTVSLDSKLFVQSLVLGEKKLGNSPIDEFKLRGFTGTLGRFPYIGINQPAVSSQSKLSIHRTHTGSDPLACLSVTDDGGGGQVVFAGGHDDVVLAYGINSACAVASVYSHRDAVTGLDVIPRPPLVSETVFWTDITTHIMVSGSWDATVKVWSVTVASGETVSINREPLAELFDADSTIVCLSATYMPGSGIAICTGCSDGSFVAWLCHDDGTKVVIHKEPPRRGPGACSGVVWAKQYDRTFLFAGFATGKIASYILENGRLTRVSAVSIGVAAQCLEFVEGILLVGCSDGSLRLLPLRDGAAFDGKPTLWNAVNGKDSPGVTCISVGFASSFNDKHELGGKCICVTGGDDGSVGVFELGKVDLL